MNSASLLIMETHQEGAASDTTRPSERLALHRDRIRDLVAKHHARAPRIFGSVAAGTDRADSDLDILVEFDDEASLLDQVALWLDLVDLLGIDVDLVSADGLRGRFRERILAEAIPL